MYRNTLLLACVLASFFTGRTQKLFTDTISISAAGATQVRPMAVYLPQGYTADKTYPLVVYLHGLSQAGTDASKLLTTGLPYVLKQGYHPLLDFIMVAVQSPTYSVPPEWLPGLVQQARQRWHIDRTRVYLTGIDAGGWGAFGSQLALDSSFAQKIAAIATISATTRQVDKSKLARWQQSRAPLWAVAGQLDSSYVLQNKTFVNALNQSVPGVATFTTLPGVGHGGWNAVYRGEVKIAGKTVWEWFSQYRRGTTSTSTLSATATPPALLNQTTLATTTTPAIALSLYSHIEAEQFSNRSGILIQTCRDFAGGVQNTFDAQQGDWISYNVNAPASGQYTLCFRVACDADGSRFQITNSNGTILTTVNVPNTNGWQTWRDVTAVVTLASGTQTLKLQTASTTGWNMNYFEVAKTPLNAFASYTLRPNSGTSIYLPLGLNLAHLKPGDTLNIEGGAYNVIELGNFRGNATNPLIIRNRNGQVTCKIIRLSHLPEYFKLLGNGDPNVTYGFQIDGNYATGSCLTAFGTDFEIAYVEAMQSKSGFFIKKNPDADDPLTQFPNYEMDNISINHNYIHHITGEGMYIGHTAPDGGQGGNPLLPVRMRNVEIAYNRVDQTGWDGIQLSNATTGNKIHHNVVTNFGTTNVYGQQAGIILGGNTQGDIYENTINYGTGNGIQNFGFGLNKIYGNTIEKVGRNGTDRGYETVYCNDIIIKSEVRPKQQIVATNNTIKYPMSWGAIRVSGYNKNSLPATMQYNKVLLPNAPSDWQKKYFPTYVPYSIISGNSLLAL